MKVNTKNKIAELKRKEEILEANNRANWKARSDIRKQLFKLEELPTLKKLYQGKYFKYDNGTYGDDRWWLYSYCKKIVDENEIICDEFQKSSLGVLEFRPNTNGHVFTFQIEITEDEYRKALSEMINELSIMVAPKKKAKKKNDIQRK